MFNLRVLIRKVYINKYGSRNVLLRWLFQGFQLRQLTEKIRCYGNLLTTRTSTETIAVLKSLDSKQQTVVRLKNTTAQRCCVDEAVSSGGILSQYLYTVDIMRDVDTDYRTTRCDKVNIR